MSDNEYERFEITDYDLENEFNPHRGRKRLTKNQQIYGIWADDSDGEEVELSASRRSRKPKDYTAPVNFVAGGIQQSGKKEKEETDDTSCQITDEEDDQPSSRKPLGRDSSNESDSDDSVRGHSTAPAKLTNTQPQSRRGNSGLASWEQHTKGIGAKLLLQMGYKPGKGLGKDLQGISQPVEAHMRKGRGAIGAYGPEKKSEQKLDQGKTQFDDNERDAREFEEKLKMWSKESRSEKKKTKHYYRSVQDVIEKGKKTENILPEKYRSKLSNVTVIDMTGPEKRVLSGYHALGQTKVLEGDIYEHRTAQKCTNFSLPELMHNLNLIVDLCEQEIISVDKLEKETSEKQKNLEIDKDNLERIVKLEADHIDTLKEALELVESLTKPETPLTLDRAEKIFIELQTDYTTEFKEFSLGDLAAGVVAPLVNSELEKWKPLEHPTYYLQEIKKWRNILGMHQQESRSVFDPYSSLIWAGIVPSFRAAVAQWNPKHHQPMAALLDAWAPLFPTWILDNVLEQLILPQLNTAVQNWDPLTDTIPIHIWILPWSAILSHKMEEQIYPTIRRKLGHALQAWVPQDRSARAMLTPWKTAFGEAEMQSFLLKHITPKLQMTLSEMIINPLQQDLEPWNQVWEWKELVSTHTMTHILDKYFFPKFMQTLVIWLNQSPNLDQISRWYAGWKNQLSDDILQQPSIKEHFRRALELMHRATGTLSNSPEATPSASIPNPATHPPALMDLQIPPPPQIEFKELVSQRCAEVGIIFAPMPGRREFGKQVYRIGKLFCYIDRTVLMVSDGNLSNWTPISLGSLLERAALG